MSQINTEAELLSRVLQWVSRYDIIEEVIEDDGAALCRRLIGVSNVVNELQFNDYSYNKVVDLLNIIECVFSGSSNELNNTVGVCLLEGIVFTCMRDPKRYNSITGIIGSKTKTVWASIEAG